MEHWEYLIGIGIQTLLFLLGGWGMVLKNNWSNEALKEQINGMKEELKQLALVITTQAVQTQRIDSLSASYVLLHRTVEDLRRGMGWVTGRKTVDGEY